MAATALVASLVAVVGSTAATSPAAAAAPLPALALDVVSARTAGPKPDFAQKGDVVTDYKFLVQKIEAGDPTQSAAYCLPMNKGNAGASNANYPAGCNWPGTRTSNTGDPIVAQGTQDDVASVTTDKLADGHYIVSVKADGYEIGAGYFDVPLTSPVKVELQPYPLPLATIRVRVFQDIVPADGVYEIDAEPGIRGFRAFLNDLLGDVSTDYYGNPICTQYKHNNAGQVVFVDGKPVIATTLTPGSVQGQCLSDSNGDIVIPNMAPGRYGIVVRQSSDKKSWMQTTTLEGAQDHDWWVMAGDTGWGQETTWGGELVPEVQFGFVPPEPTVGHPWTGFNANAVPPADTFSTRVSNSARQAVGNRSISGSVHEGCTYIASTSGGYVANAVPGANGTKDCGPIKNPYIAVSGLDVGDQVVWAGSGDVNGNYTVPGLAPGSYMVTVWDAPINHILETLNITIPTTGTGAVQAGTTYLGGWFTHITGSVFVDTNGNGRKDAGERGVVRTTLAYRERDNTPMDQFTNAIDTDANGNYDILQAYPLNRFMILEHANPRYKPTGITVQACNEPKATTYVGGAVDISVLPVIGLCGRVDWGVQPYATGETGGIVGTVTYGVTRNELDPANSATESWQPGIPGVTVHLHAAVTCENYDPAADFVNVDDASRAYYGTAYTATCLDGNGAPDPNKATDALATPVTKAGGKVVSGGDVVYGPELAEPYISETYKRPTGCTARDRTGAIMTGEQILPKAGDKNYECVEAPLSGFQALPNDETPGATAQDVNGNYGFGTSLLNLYPKGDPRNPGTDAANPYANNDLPLYANLADAGFTGADAEQSLPAGQYVVSVDIPQDEYGTPKYKPTREEDINIFTGDDMAPQENFPPVPGNDAGDPPKKDPGTGIDVGTGVEAGCAGPLHTVNVTDADFIAGGGSPYEGQDKPLCTAKLVDVVDATQQVTNFELFTDVPIASHFWGLILNDLGVSSDPATIQYGEVEGLKNAPTGIYDWAGNLVTTAVADPNGFYEAVVPSTTRINNPSPSGVSPNMFRLVGNDPGQPGHLNPTYDSRYRTIATNFQAWPGLWTVTDTAPTLTAAQTFNGQMTAVRCDVPTAEPQLFAVDNPVTSGAQTVTIKGRDFGATQGSGAVLIGNAGDRAVDPTTAAPLAVTSWSDTEIKVLVPAGGSGIAAGARQILVKSGAGKVSAAGITLHILGSGYNPTVFKVGPGQAIDTDSGGTVQSALETASHTPGISLVVAYPQTPTADNPRGDILENIVIHSGVEVQGVGPGGFRADGSYVPGSVLNGERFQEGQPTGNAWLTLVTALTGRNTDPVSPSQVKNGDLPIPDSATVTILTPTDGTGSSVPAVDGFWITGGIQQTTPTNINVLTGGPNTPYGGTGAVVTQGGAVYIHGGSTNVAITNNRIEGNSGSYAGAIRVGTPYANGETGIDAAGTGLTAAPSASSLRVSNQNLVVAHNRILSNGGANLAGGIGLFSGTYGYRVSWNDVCGNFSAEYGGAISHYGLSDNGSIQHNRIWFNESYDEGGAIMVAGEIPATPDHVSGGAGRVTISDNKIDENLSNDDGGGIRLLNAGARRILISNNEIVNNVSAHEGGGIALNDATDVVIVNNTIAKNMTTATAVTSNGQPAPAGISTTNLSTQLYDAVRASIDSTQPDFTDAVTYNNVIWDNRAGSFLNGLAITGLGDTGAYVWNVGSLDIPTPLSVNSSVVGPVTTAPESFAGTNNVTTDPAFVLPRTVSVHADARRSFVAFRQTVISDMTVNPWNLSNYRIASGSSAEGRAAATFAAPGGPVTAPTVDLTGLPRTNPFDSGAWELLTVNNVPAALAAPTWTTDSGQLTFSWNAAATVNPPVTSYTLRLWSAASGGNLVGSCLGTATSCTITGLTNGTHYYADVIATNAAGSSVPSQQADAVPAASVPSLTSVTSLDGGLRVVWSHPTSVVTRQGYAVHVYSTQSGGAALVPTCTTNASGTTCDVTGLANGTAYWVDVTLTYVGGATATSTPRVTGTPKPQAPGAPVITRVEAGSSLAAQGGSLKVTFTPGATNGAAVTYTARAYASATPGGPELGSCSVPATTSITSKNCTITSTQMLLNATYWVDVTATAGSYSTVSSPRVSGLTGSLPPAPAAPTVAYLFGGAVVSWATVSSTPASSYRVNVFTSATSTTPIANRSCTPSQFAPTTCTITGLTLNTTYWFRVTADNGVGATLGAPRQSTVRLFGAAAIAVTPLSGPAGTLVAAWSAAPLKTGTTRWLVRAYPSATSTTVLSSCLATAKAKACTVSGLKHGRTYYLSVWRLNSKAPSVRLVNHTAGRAR